MSQLKLIAVEENFLKKLKLLAQSEMVESFDFLIWVVSFLTEKKSLVFRGPGFLGLSNSGKSPDFWYYFSGQNGRLPLIMERGYPPSEFTAPKL